MRGIGKEGYSGGGHWPTNLGVAEALKTIDVPVREGAIVYLESHVLYGRR